MSDAPLQREGQHQQHEHQHHLGCQGKLLQSPSQRLFNMGLFTSREFAAGTDRDAALAYEVDLALLKAVGGSGPLRGDRAALVIDLLADRNAGGAGAAVQQALLESAAAGEPAVQLAAIRAVGRCGDAASAARLLEVAETGAGPLVAAARQAVTGMTADGVDEKIVARLDATTALPLIVGLIGDRRILTASAKVRPLADHADPAVRSAALAALGSIVSLGDLGILVRRVAAPRDEAEGGVAAAALKEAAVRMPDRDGCAAAIAAGLGSAGDRAGLLLETLGDVGGPKALATVAAAAASGDAPLQDAATRVLGKWMTADAAPVLLDLATTDKAGSYRGRALKGYLRIARHGTVIGHLKVKVEGIAQFYLSTIEHGLAYRLRPKRQRHTKQRGQQAFFRAGRPHVCRISASSVVTSSGIQHFDQQATAHAGFEIGTFGRQTLSGVGQRNHVGKRHRI